MLTNSLYPRIEEENIKCYKVLKQLDDNNFYSPFQNVRYKTDSLNCAFNNIQLSENNYMLIGLRNVYNFDKGFLHCFTETGLAFVEESYFEAITPNGKLFVFECYIPKGEPYYESINEYMVCANKLFVTNNYKELTF